MKNSVRPRIVSALVHLLPALLGLTPAACGPLGSDGGAAGQEARDLAQYNQIEQMLLANRADFLTSTYSYTWAIDNQLFFLSFPGSDPGLHRYDKTTGKRLDYSFSIGSFSDFNYRASGSFVVTAANDGSQVTYSAYAADQVQTLAGTTVFPIPPDAQWWAYAVSGGTVYVVTQDQTGTLLSQWTPGSSSQPLFTLESAAGQPQLGQFLDFDVDGNTMVFLEGSRIWSLDLQARRATWLMNMSQLGDTVDVETDGVLYTTTQGLTFYDLATHSPRNLSDLIKSSPYQLNSTFSQAHYFTQDFARYGRYVLYGGMDGIFSYQLDTGAIAPVLLNPMDSGMTAPLPADSPLVYRYPAVVTSGTMYITGLQGADGAIYSVDLTKALP